MMLMFPVQFRRGFVVSADLRNARSFYRMVKRHVFFTDTGIVYYEYVFEQQMLFRLTWLQEMFAYYAGHVFTVIYNTLPWFDK